MTAAHCVRRVKRSKIRIILGDHDQTVINDADAKMRAVSAIIKHRHFDSNTYNHDIALLKLRKPIQYSKNIMPVCLPLDDFDPAGKTGIAVGWGTYFVFLLISICFLFLISHFFLFETKTNA